VTEKRRMADYGDALASELHRDEGKLARATEEVEELREKLLRHENVRPWLVERAEALKGEIQEARALKTQYSTHIVDQRDKIKAARADREKAMAPQPSQLAQQEASFLHPSQPSQPSKPLQSADDRALVTPSSAAATIAAANAELAAKARSRSASSNAAGRSGLYADGNLPKGHDEVKRSIERLRDQFHNAVQQARVSIAAT